MPSNTKAVRLTVTRYSMKNKNVVSVDKQLTVAQIARDISGGLARQAVGRGNLASLCNAMVSGGIASLGYKSLRAWATVAKVSHTSVASYAAIGKYASLTAKLANGAKMTVVHKLAKALANPKCHITEAQALLLCSSTNKGASAAIANVTDSDSDSDSGSDSGSTKDKMAEYATAFDAMTLVELQQIDVLLQAAILAKA